MTDITTSDTITSDVIISDMGKTSARRPLGFGPVCASIGLALGLALLLSACGGGSPAAPVQPDAVAPPPSPPTGGTTAPVISDVQPADTIPAGTITTKMSFATDTDAECRWTRNAGNAFDDMEAIAESGARAHALDLYNLKSGEERSVAVRCRDASGNTHDEAQMLSVSVGVLPSATVSWDAPTTRADGGALGEIESFAVYYGTAPDDLRWVEIVEDPTVTRHTLDGMQPGTFAFTVTAFDVEGRESERAEPVVATLD